MGGKLAPSISLRFLDNFTLLLPPRLCSEVDEEMTICFSGSKFVIS